jgi:predicted GNAT superfamily acetyltransferase
VSTHDAIGRGMVGTGRMAETGPMAITAGAPHAGSDDLAELARDAREVADEAARRLGIRMVELHEVAQHRAAAELVGRIWGADPPDIVIGAGMLTTLSHSGNYVVGAYDDTGLVGVAAAFFGRRVGPARGASDGHLHSHVAGVDRARVGGGVGWTIKQHQRAWALARGVSAVCWTFDPLIRRNAYFNLQKLGALPEAYLPDCYGPMADAVNAGDPSDRFFLRWQLDSARAVAAAHGEVPAVDVDALLAAGAVVRLDRDAADGPRPLPPRAGRTQLVAVPGDIEALRAADPALGARWRHEVREALTPLVAAGFQVTAISRQGWYVLERSADA